jgi:hypothetical protein
MPLSLREVRYPEIEEPHRASSLASGEAVAAWRAGVNAVGPTIPDPLFDASAEDVIRDRRFTRRVRTGFDQPGAVGFRTRVRPEADPW